MPRIRITGELSVRRKVGIGALKLARWTTTSFDETLTIDQIARPVTNFEIEAVNTLEGVLIRGKLKGIRCDFGEIVDGKGTSLAAPSVGGVKLVGRAEMVEA